MRLTHLSWAFWIRYFGCFFLTKLSFKYWMNLALWSHISLVVIYAMKCFQFLYIQYIYFCFWNTNPGNADLNAAGYKAAGRNAGPQGGNRIGDHVRNGPVEVIIFPNDAGDIREVFVVSDGEHRRFLMSATIEIVILSNFISKI